MEFSRFSSGEHWHCCYGVRTSFLYSDFVHPVLMKCGFFFCCSFSQETTFNIWSFWWTLEGKSSGWMESQNQRTQIQHQYRRTQIQQYKRQRAPGWKWLDYDKAASREIGGSRSTWGRLKMTYITGLCLVTYCQWFMKLCSLSSCILHYRFYTPFFLRVKICMIAIQSSTIFKLCVRLIFTHTFYDNVIGPGGPNGLHSILSSSIEPRGQKSRFSCNCRQM